MISFHTYKNRSILWLCCGQNTPGSSRCQSLPAGRPTTGHTWAQTPGAPWTGPTRTYNKHTQKKNRSSQRPLKKPWGGGRNTSTYGKDQTGRKAPEKTHANKRMMLEPGISMATLATQEGEDVTPADHHGNAAIRRGSVRASVVLRTVHIHPRFLSAPPSFPGIHSDAGWSTEPLPSAAHMCACDGRSCCIDLSICSCFIFFQPTADYVEKII